MIWLFRLFGCLELFNSRCLLSFWYLVTISTLGDLCVYVNLLESFVSGCFSLIVMRGLHVC